MRTPIPRSQYTVRPGFGKVGIFLDHDVSVVNVQVRPDGRVGKQTGVVRHPLFVSDTYFDPKRANNNAGVLRRLGIGHRGSIRGVMAQDICDLNHCLRMCLASYKPDEELVKKTEAYDKALAASRKSGLRIHPKWNSIILGRIAELELQQRRSGLAAPEIRVFEKGQSTIDKPDAPKSTLWSRLTGWFSSLLS